MLNRTCESLGARPAEALATGLGLTTTLGLLMLVPLLVGGYVEADRLPLAQASILITVEVASGIVALIATVFRCGSMQISRVARIGALLAAIAYLASAPGLTFWPLVGCRIASGVGVGVLGAAVNASVARAANPERLYATALFFYGAAASALLYLVPALCAKFGYWALFGTTGALFLGTAVFAPALSHDRLNSGVQRKISIRLGAGSHRRQAIGLIGGYFLLWIAFSMVWIFAERKAASIHMGAEDTGLALSACNLIGLSGSLAVNWLGDRFGRALPIAIGGTILAASFYAIGIATEPLVYWVAIVTYGVSYFFVLPYIFGQAAELDSLGRVAILASAVPWISHLVSPLLGALLLARFGAFGAMAGVTACTAIVATIVLVVTTLAGRGPDNVLADVPLTKNHDQSSVNIEQTL